ncbi:ABC transporter [Roseateles aquatilis]|uniref:ABC transporter n=1 Tax=Roseateles aquatilis TaxID=431061 RepID=A0A246JED0_9BURK|nr:ABC transporter [Roseateles aquatilis]
MIARLVGVTKSYTLGGARLDALADIDLSIQDNRFTVLSGASGSGKTTLLNLVGCIDRPSAGHVFVDGQDTSALTDEALSDFRAASVGFIFQSFNLISVLSCEENVEYPLLLAGADPEHRRRRVRELLAAVGLQGHASHLPGQLSGGQRQRVAIARALANRPKLVLADEPTANLDSATGASIIALMRDMQQREHTAFVFSSHDPNILSQADDAVFIRDGRIVDRVTSPAVLAVSPPAMGERP